MSEEENDPKDHKNFADVLRKVVNTGISAAFMTEDAVKGIVNDLPLPKEIINGLLQNAKNTRNEFITSVKTELRNHLDKIDVSKEIDRIAENYDFEINAKIKLTPKAKKKKKSSSDK
ncbi:MAG: hypothetical protein CME62_10230 [Halobacteriovoraceae bacterium]|nr:hypothetical protein [Halobacteriovoraceae bacterium]|tara:strand:- start:9256 stop:9606 length:351 start_codon:yes stop_codon:yes gene_type:complete